MSPEEKRKHLAAAKRWHGRKKTARSRPDELRCHREAMRHLYSVLGHVPKDGGPGSLI